MLVKRFNRAAVAIAVCSSLTLFAGSALANNVDGSLQGQVVAKVGEAPISGATVTIENEKNGYKRVLTVAADGSFDLKTIPVGTYNLTISKAGFRTESIKNVTIGIGKAANLEVSLTQGDVEVISITGSRVSVVDVTSSEATFNISATEIDRLPIPADITSVALLAPGVNLGDSRFEDSKGNKLASFGGSSQAENTYYVNGLNMTNFRNGVGGSSIPFLSYESFQVKTGGYSAEFGRSTGGVVSAVTKKGSNDFEFGLRHRQDFGSLQGDKPSSRYLADDCAYTVAEDGKTVDKKCAHKVGDLISDNSRDISTKRTTDIYASGAIIEDTLFFYGLYEWRSYESEQYASVNNRWEEKKDDDPYYLARLDWNINEDHQLMAWYFTDETTEYETETDLDENKQRIAGTEKESTFVSGGDSWSIRYTGLITEDLSISAMAGSVGFSEISRGSGDECPVVYDLSARQSLGCWSNFTIATDKDERKQYRFDVDWYATENHNLRFGLDVERNTSQADTALSGGVYYAYRNYDAGTVLPNGHTIAEDGRYSRVRNYGVGGTFEINNQAIYIEDIWTVTDRLTANLGFRWESFENMNAAGETFIEMKNQFAPRLGLSYDLFGDGDHKIFANVGRYHLPVAANTNVRLAGAETYTHDYHELDGVNADDTPILGKKLGETHVIGDGIAPSPISVTDANLGAYYQDELILGYQGLINEDWSWGVKLTRREVGDIIDDASVDKALKAKGVKNDHHFLLLNPGKGVSFQYDGDGDGKLEQHTYTAAELGYDQAVRNYTSLDFTLEKSWDGLWMFRSTYTWAKSYGNAEGYIKSDNGQDDAGLTTDWDYPYLMDGAYGDLPNDKRHALKFLATYQLADNVAVGLNASITSGRPRNALGAGYYPDQDSYSYGNTYYVGETKFSRGSLGRTPWTQQFNANIKYDFSDLVAGFAEAGSVTLNVYNMFNSTTPLRYEENAETGGAFNANATYGAERSWQTPRKVEVMFDIKF